MYYSRYSYAESSTHGRANGQPTIPFAMSPTMCVWDSFVSHGRFFNDMGNP